MKSKVIIINFLSIFLLVIPLKAEQENSQVSATFFSFTSIEEFQNSWNLHSAEMRKVMNTEWDIQKKAIFAFSALAEKGKIPGYTPERLKNFKNLTLYGFNLGVEDLKSKDPIFSNIIYEMSGCDSSFIIEISSQDSELKYFICFSPQGKIEIRSAYVFEEEHWKKLN